MRGDAMRLMIIGVLAASAAFGQIAASISGRILDQSGASVPQATIIIRSLETGAARTTITNDAGDYRITSLPLGPQEIRAEKPQFKPVVREGVTLDETQ